MRQPRILARRVPPLVVWSFVILSATLAGQWLQSRVHLNHDVSYFVHFDRWLLQGRILGSDLFDGNLPMVWVLFMPSAVLAQLNLLDEPSAVRVIFWAYFLVSTALLVGVLSQLEGRDRPASIGWVVAFVLIATLGPGFSFGQREHACVLFAMPYLAAAVLRLQGGQGPRTSIAVVIGLLAGIGFALKPYFLAVPALVELLLLVRLGWRSLFFSRVESLVLGFTVFAYVVLAGLIIPDYLKATIELARATYWAYDTGNFSVILRTVRPRRAACPVRRADRIADAHLESTAHRNARWLDWVYSELLRAIERFRLPRVPGARLLGGIPWNLPRPGPDTCMDCMAGQPGIRSGLRWCRWWHCSASCPPSKPTMT